MIEVMVSENETFRDSASEIVLSPFVETSRGTPTRRKTRDRRRSSYVPVSTLFEDLDPDSSPLIQRLDRKAQSGEKICEEDFIEPFPEFRRKMEKEFDEITEQFKRLSIENPDEIIDEHERNLDIENDSKSLEIIDSSEVETKTVRSKNLKTFLFTCIVNIFVSETLNLL